MELITARAGKPHITPMQDAMWHRGLTETDSCIFDAFEKFKADIITANEIRVRSGVGMVQGRFFEIPPNTYDSAVIANGTQGQKRIDLIVCRVTVNESENTQKAETAVIQGTPTTGTPQAPAPINGDLDNGDTVADYPLYAVNISGITITSVTPQFETGWLVSAETVKMFADAGYPMADRKVDKALQQTVAMVGEKTEIDLLWENASPGSSFAAQTIKLGLSGYNYVDITVRANNDKASEYTTRLKVDGGQTDIGAMGSTGLYRPATPTQAGVAFLAGRTYTAYNTSNTVQSNNYCVPVKIYGIKGAA